MQEKQVKWSYPDWLFKQREEINVLLGDKIASTFEDPFLRQEIKRCTFPGRKIRSILFLNTLRLLNPDVDLDYAASIIFSIELGHAASVLVDDILDGDYFRHGTVSTEVLWGNSKAVLFAHFMSSSAINSLRELPIVQSNFIKVYQSLSIGEMYDIFLIPGEWVYNGYSSKVFQKTSALFEFSLSSAQNLAGSEFIKYNLDAVGKGIGTLYQLSNDFYDWQPEGIRKRHLEDQSWQITFSFPLATYLQRFGDKEISSYLKKKHLSFDEWMNFLPIIWNEEVRNICFNLLTSTQKDLDEFVIRLNIPIHLKQIYRNLISLIGNEMFWYHEYEIP